MTPGKWAIRAMSAPRTRADLQPSRSQCAPIGANSYVVDGIPHFNIQRWRDLHSLAGGRFRREDPGEYFCDAEVGRTGGGVGNTSFEVRNHHLPRRALRGETRRNQLELELMASTSTRSITSTERTSTRLRLDPTSPPTCMQVLLAGQYPSRTR